jgi:MFS family permease
VRRRSERSPAHNVRETSRPDVAAPRRTRAQRLRQAGRMSNLADRLRVLRHRDFRYLWFAQSASVIGDCIVIVALALYVIELTGDATDLGLVFAAASLPLVAFLLIGGVWADRLPRHRVMVATDLVRFALHGLLAALIFASVVHIWELIAIEALFGTAEAFFRPAANGLLPQTVPEQEIQQAQGLSALSNNIGEFAGPALATALVLGLGAGWAFALDAATFLLSAALLTRVRPRRRALSERNVAQSLKQGGVWAELREGFAEVRSRSWVWATLAAFCVALFTGLAPWFVLGPLVARVQYGHIGIYGLVSAAVGVGTIAGSLLGIAWRPRFPMRAAMLAILLWPAAAVLYAVGLTLWLVVPAAVIGGAGIALFDVWWTTALAERIPPDKLSRVSSYDWMVSLALLPLGYVLAGPLADALGPVEVLLGGSALAVLALAFGLLPRETRMLRRLDAAKSGPRANMTDALPGLPHR